MKKLTLITSLIILSLLTSQGQEQKFELGLSLFPSYSIGIISDNTTPTSPIGSTVEENEIWKPSFCSNIFVDYRLSKNSIVGIGIGYQNNGERTKKTDINFSTPDPSLPLQVRFIYNRYNIEIRIYYKHMLHNKFFVLVGTSGLINIYNTTTNVQYFPNNSNERNIENDISTDYREFNISGNFGFGLDYFSTKKATFFLLPYIQYGILGISKSATLNRNFLSLGISTGIKL